MEKGKQLEAGRGGYEVRNHERIGAVLCKDPRIKASRRLALETKSPDES